MFKRCFKFSWCSSFLLLLATACSSVSQTSQQKVVLELMSAEGHQSACIRRFGDGVWVLQEKLCDQEDDGISVYHQSELWRRYEWFDEGFSRWSLHEHCELSQCAYILHMTPENEIVQIEAEFTINLTHAWFRLRPCEQKLIVIEKKYAETPS